MKILLFIVTYKASYRIKKVIQEIPFKYLNKYNYKILISDDSSNDNTLNYIKNIKKKFSKKVIVNFNLKNLGYGGNIKKCLSYAYKKKYTHAIMIHGDNQYSSKYIKKMLQDLNEERCSAITGSRMKNKNSALKGGMPIYKFIGNIFLTKLFNLIHGTSFTDCHTGYWLYDLKSLKMKQIRNFDNGFLFDLDMRINLLKNKKRIIEIPIITRYGNERSSIHLIYAFNFFLKSILKRFFN